MLKKQFEVENQLEKAASSAPLPPAKFPKIVSPSEAGPLIKPSPGTMTLTGLRSSLFELLTDTEMSFDEIVEEISHIMNNPIVVVDRSFYLISNSDESKMLDVFWKKNIEQKFCSPEFIVQFSHLPDVVRSIQVKDSFEVFCPYSPYNKVVGKISNGDEHVGYVVLVCCQQEGDDLSEAAVGEIARMLGLRWSESISTTISHLPLKQKILTSMIDGDYQTFEEMENVSKSLKFEVPHVFHLVAVNMNSIGEDPVIRNQMGRFIETYFSKVDYLWYRDFFLAVVPHSEVRQLTGEIKETYHSNNRQSQIPVGVSRVVTSPDHCPTAFMECVQALNLGQDIFTSAKIFYYAEIHFYNLLLSMDAGIGMKEFSDPLIEKLTEYDQENEASLLKTFYYYLLYNRSLQQTAKELYVHRNTVSFRINKVEQVLGVDLNDEELCQRLLLSMRIVFFFESYYYRTKGGEPKSLYEGLEDSITETA